MILQKGEGKMVICPVDKITKIEGGVSKCPLCGADLSTFLRVWEVPEVY